MVERQPGVVGVQKTFTAFAFLFSSFDYGLLSLSCQGLSCKNLSSQSELAAGPILKKRKGGKASRDGESESVDWTQNGPRELIGGKEEIWNMLTH